MLKVSEMEISPLTERSSAPLPSIWDTGRKLSGSGVGNSHIDKMARHGWAEEDLRFSFPESPLVPWYLRLWK